MIGKIVDRKFALKMLKKEVNNNTRNDPVMVTKHRKRLGERGEKDKTNGTWEKMRKWVRKEKEGEMEK